jgi:cytochrome P450
VPLAPASFGAWQVYRTARRNVLELLPEAAFRERFVSRTSWPAWQMVIDPDLVKHMLRRHEPINPRSDVSLRILRPNEGESIFVAYGAFWRRQHKAMTPVFQHRAIAGVGPEMTAAAETGAARLSAAASGIVDVYPAMVAVTSDVICDAALSGREQLDRPGLTAAVSRCLGSVAPLFSRSGGGIGLGAPPRLRPGGARRGDAPLPACRRAEPHRPRP